MIKKENTN